MTITQPGFVYDMPESVYHSDPAPVPSLSSGCARMLVAKSPLHAMTEHPRLGATRAIEVTDEMDFGSLAHKLLLGRGAEIAVLEADTWRGKEAGAFWDKAQAGGKIPCLTKTLDRARLMTARIEEQLQEVGLGHVFNPGGEGKSEVAAFWQEGDAWCRSLMDRLLIDEMRLSAEIFDLKTMSQSAHPRACAARIASMGYDLQRAHYMRGLEVLRPDLAGRISFTFIFVETSAPFAVTPVELSGEWAAVGQSKWQRALDRWKECTATNHWPGYAADTLRLEAPAWALAQELDLEQQ